MSDEDESSNSAGHIIATILRDLFIGGKCMVLIIKTIQGSRRYYHTYDTLF